MASDRIGLYVGELSDADIDLVAQLLRERAQDRARRIPEDTELVRRLFRLASLFQRCSGVIVSQLNTRED